MSDHHRPETNAVHAGRVIDAATGAVAPPIHLSTTFERDPDGTYPRGYTYATFNNPNRAWLEEAITDLEGGAAAIATSSGMAAIACVLGSLKPGERVIVSYDLFQGTARLLNDQLRQWGIEADVVDTTRPEEVEAAIRPETRMVWVDTPSNPLMRVTDIARAVEIARRRGIRVAVDSTFATFALQRPLDLGADVTVYAATKYIAGHSDVVNGLAVFREKDELYERARAFQINVGLTPSPFDCWLVHRGLRTLPCRMRAHSQNAQAVASFLEGHPRVDRVYYPGLASNEGRAVARRQMPHGCGGMLSFSVKGGREAAMGTVARVKLFTRAASLGGVESLIEHRASSPIQTRGQGTGLVLPDDLLRLSVGIEHAGDLISDLDQALNGNWTP
jgi:cystathionine gamma-synthase